MVASDDPGPGEPVDLLGLLHSRRLSPGGYAAVDAGGGIRELSFRELADQAASAAHFLARYAGVHEDSSSPSYALVAAADPLMFTVGYFAALEAGMVPIPAPGRVGENPAHARSITGILRACRPAAVLADESTAEELTALLGPEGPSVHAVRDMAAEPAGSSADRARPRAVVARSPGDIAYVQFTSGSTADPKPVVLENRHVLAQLRQAAEAFGESPDCTSVNWVPLHHDMGLVTGVLRPLYSAYTSVLLDPVDFARRPSLWIEQLSRWRATHTSAPDFGYALAARRGAATEGLDLSALRVARNAGEPVRERTLADFAERFAPIGFRSGAFCPSYGLAEATLTVTTCPVTAEPTVLEVSRAALGADSVNAPRDADDAVRLVSCGPPLAGTTVRILAQDGSAADPDRVGEVWIAGPQVCRSADAEIDGLTGLRTGDLGFLYEGELVLTGRHGERFQVRGVNHYCADVELAVTDADPRLRPGRTAVFLAGGDPDGAKPLVVAAEVRGALPPAPAEGARLRTAIVRSVSRDFGLSVARVVLLPAGSLPVTTSGKLRRGACRAMYEAGRMPSFPLRSEEADVRA